MANIRIGVYQRGGKGYSIYYGKRGFYAQTLKEADGKVGILARKATEKGYTPVFTGIAKPPYSMREKTKKAYDPFNGILG